MYSEKIETANSNSMCETSFWFFSPIFIKLERIFLFSNFFCTEAFYANDEKTSIGKLSIFKKNAKST